MAQPHSASESPTVGSEFEDGPDEQHSGRRLSDLVWAALVQAIKQGRNEIAERLSLCCQAIDDDEEKKGYKPRRPKRRRRVH